MVGFGSGNSAVSALLGLGFGEDEGDDGLAGVTDFFQELALKVVGIGIHEAMLDFVAGCFLEAKFADADAIFGPNWWSENTACHGTECIQVAEASQRVEGGTGLIIGKVLEPSAIRFGVAENAGASVAGETGAEILKRLGSAFADSGGAMGVGSMEFAKTVAEASGIELVYGEDSDAALGAPRSAGEMLATPGRGVRECGVDDLD